MSDKGHNCLEVGMAHVPDCAQKALNQIICNVLAQVVEIVIQSILCQKLIKMPHNDPKGVLN